MKKLLNKKYMLFFKKTISVALTFIILFNAGTQAFAGIDFVPPAVGLQEELKTEIQTTVTDAIQETAPEQKDPKEFLADLVKSLEEAASDETNTEDVNRYARLTKDEYIARYNENLNNEYNTNRRKVETKAREALAAFDREAQEVVEEQERILNEQLPILNFSLPSVQDTTGAGLTLTPIQDFRVSEPGTADSFAQMMGNMAQREQILNDLNEAIAEQRAEYEEEVNQWKSTTYSALSTEKTRLEGEAESSYDQYFTEYNAKLQEFYSALVEEVIENYKLTQVEPQNRDVSLYTSRNLPVPAYEDLEAKQNFVSILMFLTSIKSRGGFDRFDFIKGDSRTYILNFLKSNFSPDGWACASSIKTRYVHDYQYGQVRGIGGSAGAGLIFENSSSKESYLHIDNKEKCDVALSSFLPYANLNGNGNNIYYFMKQYYEQPLFGSMVQIGVKSLLLTDYKGDDGLTKLIDDGIRIENEAREGKTNFWGRIWDGLDIFTFEGITRRLSYDGKFCQHNLCSSANAGPEAPNAWEEAAYMIAEAGKTDLLNKAIDQCHIVSNENLAQHMECNGLYPFLFGTLIAKPELANRIQPVRPLSEEQAQENIRLNDKYDITNKHTQGEWIAALLTLQSFEDLHPVDVLRMNNLVADSNVLNPRHEFIRHTKEDDWYRTKMRRFNTKLVFMPLAAYTDFLVAIIAIKDFLRFGFTMIHKAATFTKIFGAIRTFRALPNGFTKAVKLTRLLEAKGISPKSFAKMHNFINFTKSPLVYTTGAVAARAGLESNALLVSVSGRITGIKNGVLVGTQEFARPLGGPLKGKAVFKKAPLGGMYAVGGMNAYRAANVADEPMNFRAAMAKIRRGIAESPFNPFIKPNAKDAPHINLDNLTLEVVDRNGNPIKIESITIEDNVLYINGEMFKTFKAKVQEDQLGIIAQLLKQHNISLGIDGFYIKPLWNKAPSAFEKASARWHNSEMFNVYDGEGNVIMQMGLNRGYRNDLNLINQLGETGKLVYVNNALHIEKAGVLTRVEGITGISLPKTAIFNMTKNSELAFLTDLFKMPARTDNLSPLLFRKTGNKILWPFMTQALSYSAASSSLMMTMEKEPFNFSPAGSVVIGLFLPYIWSFTSPFMVPLVKMWGAKPVLLGSLVVASAGLGIAIANGYHGNATNELDEEGRVIPKRDAEGNIIEGSYLTRQQTLPTWPLFVASATTGLASAGIRASANILIKSYELNRTTLTASMLFKNIGGMAFTAVPFVFNRLAKLDDDQFRDKRKDFSVTYPALLALTAIAGTGIALKMPKMNVPNYRPVRADFLVRPWKLLFTPQIAPYTFGMMGVSALEGYVYFKGASAFARDTFEGYGAEAENAKFMASLFTAVPQFALRFLSPRKVFYGYGLFNSVALATAGTILLTMPSDNLSPTQNTIIGALAGTALGLGTAQVFQYSQKLVIAQAAKMPGAPIKDAQTLYSMSNLGFVLPTLYAINANQRKSKLNEGEFEATKNTFFWPLLVYLLSAGTIADAERGFKVFPRVMNGFVKPALRYTVEGAGLKRTLENSTTYFRPPLQQGTPFTPSLLQPTPEPFNLQSPGFTLPGIDHSNNIFVPNAAETNDNNAAIEQTESVNQDETTVTEEPESNNAEETPVTEEPETNNAEETPVTEEPESNNAEEISTETTPQ